MDFDGDGTLDMISGSYDPGDVYLFRGLGRGKYAAGAPIRDETGLPLVHHPVEFAQFEARKGKDANSNEAIQLRVASFGSWPCAIDWDGDGDLDVLIGSFSGGVYLRLNEGTRKVPRFASASTAIDAAGGRMKVVAHADPVAADWDGDGRWDLVVGAADGSVVWFRNEGTAEAPVFAAAATLIERRAEHKFLTQYLAADEPVGRGVRHQVDVVDYDGDGKLDLLVGDYSSVRRLQPDPDGGQRAALVEIEAAEAALAKSPDRAALTALTKRKDEHYLDEGRQSRVWLFRRR